MKITLINGSPKGSSSTSQNLLDHLQTKLNPQHTINGITVRRSRLTEEQLQTVINTDVLVLAFPLYIDAVPSHLFQALVDLEDHLRGRNITVYGIVNCGFFEGEQTRNAISILKNWCRKTNLVWGCGAGCGGGEGIVFAGTAIGSGPLTTLGNNLRILAKSVNEKSGGEDLYSRMNYPRFVYKFASKYTKWHPLMKKYQVSPKEAVESAVS